MIDAAAGAFDPWVVVARFPRLNSPLVLPPGVFPDIDYLDWITGRPERAEFDLGSSDLRREPPDEGAVVPPELASIPDPGSDWTVEALLAEAYDVALENVLVTAGATHANFLAVAAALGQATERAEDEAADEETANPRVLVEKPGYEPLRATPEGLGGTLDRFRRPEEDDYSLEPDRVSGALVEGTACVVVTNRHNPSGRGVGRQTLAEVAEEVTAEDARLLVDEVYAPFSEDAADDAIGNVTVGPFGETTAAGLPNTVVTNSLTKFFGFGDVRLGWLVADETFVERARKITHHLSTVAEPSRRLARRALFEASDLASESRARLRANHDLLASFVAERDDLSGFVSPGCPYAFLEHESADGTLVAEAAWEQGVLVVPGRFFDDDTRFRLSVCGDTGEMRAGLDRLGGTLDALDAA